MNTVQPPEFALPPASGAAPPATNGHKPPHLRNSGLWDRLTAIRERSWKAGCWESLSRYVTRLVNREGIVRLRVSLSREDVAFLSSARADVLAFAELGMRLVEMHQPRRAGGISSDPDSPIRRCRACMGHWPCPTFRAVDEVICDTGRA